MHTAPVTDPSPEIYTQIFTGRDAPLAAAFQMLCERMTRLEEIAEHWLRRERQKEWMRDGLVDRQLLPLDSDVCILRDGTQPTRPLQEAWQSVILALPDLTTPANLDLNETRRLRTAEAMQRLGVEGRQLWSKTEARVKCSDVCLDSDFNYLHDAVSEDMLRAAVEREPGGLTMTGYGSTLPPSLFLETLAPQSPEYWVALGSRLFESCGIAAEALEISVLSSDVARVIVPFERSINAAPHKKRDLVLYSKAMFESLRYRNLEEVLGNCDFVNYYEMVAEFQLL